MWSWDLDKTFVECFVAATCSDAIGRLGITVADPCGGGEKGADGLGGIYVHDAWFSWGFVRDVHVAQQQQQQ